jgi:hypothetical protein
MLWHMLSSNSDYRPLSLPLQTLNWWHYTCMYGMSGTAVCLFRGSGCNKPIGSPLLHTIAQQQQAVKQPPSSSHKIW